MQKLQNIIMDYNNIRNPEATSILIKASSQSALIKFSGHFCHTCCINDYFDDFVIEAKNKGIALKIKNIKQLDDDNYIVEFLIKGGVLHDKNK